MLNETIRTLRKRKAMSQEELALQMHVVRQTISKWENGLSVPDADELVRLAKVLDSSVDELLGLGQDGESGESAQQNLSARQILSVQQNLSARLSELNRELAERRERERILEQAGKLRGLILLLTFVGILAMFTVENQVAAILLMTGCFLAALLVLYRNMGLLTAVTAKDAPLRSVRITTIFNMTLIGLCAAAAVLMEAGILALGERTEEYGAAFIVSAVILFSGYISPKLPFSRHTGLRLPWTVADEETWNVAHQTLGMTAIPTGIAYVGLVPFVSDFEVLTGIAMAAWIGIPAVISCLFYYRKFHRKK